jgi:hypothetical protein
MAQENQNSAPQQDDSQQATSNQRGAGDNSANGQRGSQQQTDPEAGITMGDETYHLHSLAKGDEDYINGDPHKDDSVQKPEQDKL